MYHEKDLPSLSIEKLNSVAIKLIDCGVEDEDDLKYVEEKDLCEILKPIPVRKLLKSWKIVENLVVDFTMEIFATIV
ncbi:hypothetical protein Avbf_02533 [Armadillidium vulgare]|nr:hypothetical protein Avbf_02533 [Armadillidium vulgare]